ncbi:MAG: gluconokinase [Pseudomonadota bacterium]
MSGGTQFVVMGVTSCGKSAVAEALAGALQAPYIEGDALHGEHNIAKMSRGDPLTDDDRWPWLARVADALAHSAPVTVASCSALCRRYRDALRGERADTTHFIHLHGSREVIAARMRLRTDHFMPTSLLDSQIALLEALEPDELGTVVDVAAPLEEVIHRAVAYARGAVGPLPDNT